MPCSPPLPAPPHVLVTLGLAVIQREGTERAPERGLGRPRQYLQPPGPPFAPRGGGGETRLKAATPAAPPPVSAARPAP